MTGRITVVAGPRRRLLLAHDEVRSVDAGDGEDDEGHLIMGPRDGDTASTSDGWVWVQPDVIATLIAGRRPRQIGHARRFDTLAHAARDAWPADGRGFVVRHGPLKLTHLAQALRDLPDGASLTVVLDPPHV
jgi:hypothetical protein